MIKKSRHGTRKGKGKGKGKSTANRVKKTIDKVQEVSDDQLKKIVTTIITEDSPSMYIYIYICIYCSICCLVLLLNN